MAYRDPVNLQLTTAIHFPKLMALLDGYMDGIYSQKDVMYRSCDLDKYELPVDVIVIINDYLEGKHDNYSGVTAILEATGMR